MKSLKYAVILLLGLSMVSMMSSCKKESSYQDKIVGEWLMTKETYYNYDLTGALVYEDVDDYPYGEDTWKFLSNGKVKTPSWYWQKSNTDDFVCDYIIEGNTLSLVAWNEIDEQDVFTIQELTNSTMVWKNERITGDIKKVRIYDLKKVN